MRWTAAVVAVLATLVAAGARAGEPGADEVAVVAADGSRLATDIARELAASGFPVLRAARFAASGAWRGVVVTDDDTHVVVVTATGSDAAHVETERTIDPRDPISRRRVCLAVVEVLRVVDRRASATPPPQPAPAPPLAVAAAPTSAGNPAPPTPPAPRWLIGVGARMALAPALLEPTSHLAFTGKSALSPRVGASIRLLWPVTGRRLDTDELHRRSWTFAATAGLEALLGRAGGRWQPYVGAAAGAQLMIAQADFLQLVQTRTQGVTSALVGASAGVRLHLGRAAHAYVELEGGDAVAVTNAPPWPPGAFSDSTGGFAGATVGMLFEN